MRDWGRRGVSRGAIVVICSDGLDRGETESFREALVSCGRALEVGLEEPAVRPA